MRAITVETTGGPEAMALADVPDPVPGPGQILIKVAAAGVNFIDIYHRVGRYPQPLPFTPGSEAAGTVVALGEGVTDLEVGQLVASSDVKGSYAEKALVNADRVIPVPEGVSAESAAAVLLQGMTAHYLVRSTYAVQPGDTVLVHAAAGDMGLLLT